MSNNPEKQDSANTNVLNNKYDHSFDGDGKQSPKAAPASDGAQHSKLRKWLSSLPALFLNSGGGTSVRTNKVLLFAANLLIMLPFILRHHSLNLVIAALAFTIIELVMLVLVRRDETAATAYLPLCLYLDAMLLILAFALPRLTGFSAAALSSVHPHFTFYVLMLAGLVLCLFKTWLSHLGPPIYLLSVSCAVFGAGSVFNLRLIPEAKILLAALVLVMLLWTFVCILAKAGNHSRNIDALNKWLGLLLSTALLFVELIFRSELLSRAHMIGEWIFSLLTRFLSWPTVLLSALILLLLAACAFRFKSFSFTVDSEVYAILGLGVLLIKIINVRYFQFNWAIVLVYSVVCLTALLSGKERILGILRPVFYPILTVICIFAALALRAGMFWMCLTTVYAAFALHSFGFKDVGKSSFLDWFFLLVCIVLEGFAFCLTKRYSTGMLVMLATIFVFSFAALLVICLRALAEGAALPKGYTAPLCVICAILTLITVLPGGIRVREESARGDVLPVQAQIKVASRDGKAAAESVEYFWTDSVFSLFAHENADPQSADSSFSTPVRCSHLIVRTTSETGLLQETHFWYPLHAASWLGLR